MVLFRDERHSLSCDQPVLSVRVTRYTIWTALVCVKVLALFCHEVDNDLVKDTGRGKGAGLTEKNGYCFIRYLAG